MSDDARVFDVMPYMQDPERTQRRQPGTERGLLAAFLDFERDTVIWKLTGLTEAQLRQQRTPSGMSLLGIVKHLAYVERNWFRIRFLDEPLTVPWRAGDPGGDFRIEPDETPESVVGFYLTEIAHARRIVAEAASLDTMARNALPNASLRWIMIHMIEETARHAGHADILRELTDGRTGE